MRTNSSAAPVTRRSTTCARTATVPGSRVPAPAPRLTGETVHLDLDWFVRKDTTHVAVSYSSAPVDLTDGGCLGWGGFVRAGGQVGYQQGFTNAAADGLAVVNHCAAGEGTGMTSEPASDPKGRPTLAWRARRSDQR